jgi:predicted nucleic acid-binding protein
MDRVVYDTNIASLALKDGLPADLKARIPAAQPVLSFVTVGELEKWAVVRSWGQRPRGAMDRWTAGKLVIDSEESVSRIWGRLAGAAHRRGDGPSENDLWIAACCLSSGLPLVTRNVKDFAPVADHHGLVVIAA